MPSRSDNLSNSNRIPAVSLELSLEEDLFMLHHCASHFFLLIHSLSHRTANSSEHYAKLTTYSDEHIIFMQRAIDRILWMHQLSGRLSKESVYFGKPLTLTTSFNFDKLNQAYPGKLMRDT